MKKLVTRDKVGVFIKTYVQTIVEISIFFYLKLTD
jgi:hypothetical protein